MLNPLYKVAAIALLLLLMASVATGGYEWWSQGREIKQLSVDLSSAQKDNAVLSAKIELQNMAVDRMVTAAEFAQRAYMAEKQDADRFRTRTDNVATILDSMQKAQKGSSCNDAMPLLREALKEARS